MFQLKCVINFQCFWQSWVRMCGHTFLMLFCLVCMWYVGYISCCWRIEFVLMKIQCFNSFVWTFHGLKLIIFFSFLQSNMLNRLTNQFKIMNSFELDNLTYSFWYLFNWSIILTVHSEQQIISDAINEGIKTEWNRIRWKKNEKHTVNNKAIEWRWSDVNHYYGVALVVNCSVMILLLSGSLIYVSLHKSRIYDFYRGIKNSPFHFISMCIRFYFLTHKKVVVGTNENLNFIQDFTKSFLSIGIYLNETIHGFGERRHDFNEQFWHFSASKKEQQRMKRKQREVWNPQQLVRMV